MNIQRIPLPSRLSKQVAGAAFRARCVATLLELGLDRRPPAALLRRAILATALVGLDRSERAWLEDIEAARRHLLADSTPVEVVDFGASRIEDVPAEEARHGRVSSRPVGQICLAASKQPMEARLLFQLVRETVPELALELGGCLGISTAYQAAALESNGRGHLISIEGAPRLAQLARDNLEALDLRRAEVRTGRFEDVLDDVLREDESISFAFVDGHHDELATLDYWRRIEPKLSTRAVVVFDDIRWSSGMRRAWSQISRTPMVQRTADLGTMGVCIYGSW